MKKLKNVYRIIHIETFERFKNLLYSDCQSVVIVALRISIRDTRVCIFRESFTTNLSDNMFRITGIEFENHFWKSHSTASQCFAMHFK